MSNSSLQALYSRLQMMVGRGVVVGVDDEHQFQELQLDLLDDETQDGVEHIQPYGLTARPRTGAESVVLGVGGLRSHAIAVVVGDRRYRLTGLQEGEVAIHDDQGQRVLLGRDGIVITGKALTVQADDDIGFEAGGNISLSAEGSVSIDGAGGISIDAGSADLVAAAGGIDLNSNDIGIGTGATLKAARDTDPVNDSTDRIAGGSSKVRIA